MIRKVITTRVRDLSLKSKYLVIIWLSLLTIGGTSLLMINYIIHKDKVMLHAQLATNLSYASLELNNALRSLENLSALIQSDVSMQTLLTDLEKEDRGANFALVRRKIYETLQNYYFSGEHIAGIAICQGDTLIHTSGWYEIETILQANDLPGIVEQGKGGNVWITLTGNHPAILSGRKINEVKNLSLKNLGALFVRLDLDSIVARSVQSISQYEQVSLHLFFDGKPVSSSHTLSPAGIMQIARFPDSYGVLEIDNSRYFIVRYNIPALEWDYVSLVDYDAVFRSITFARTLVITVIIVVTLVCISLASILEHNITKHLYILIQKIDAFQYNGGMRIMDTGYDYQNRKDELGLLHIHFDRMGVMIKNLIEENYIKELALKEEHIKQLESQMNPHFLYNTLESINWQAKAVGAHQISTMVEALGGLLRASLSKDTANLISIQEELNLIEHYFTILRIRFGEKLITHISIPLYMRDFLIPQFCLQILVENAVKYSLEKSSRVCKIMVSGRHADNLVTLTVRNTGSRFPENLMEGLRTGRGHHDGAGIGLLNVEKRIRLIFGAEYGVQVYNTERFATAKITFPSPKGKEFTGVDHR